MKLNEVILNLEFDINIFEKFDPTKKQEYLATSLGPKLVAAAEKDSQNRSKDPLEIVKTLTAADPSKGLDNLNFIARMYVAGQFKVEDISKLKNELEVFMKAKPKIQNKDINSYKSLNDLYDVTEKFAPEDLKSKGEVEKEIKDKNVVKLVDKPHFKAIIPKTEEAACFYGKGTKWCTAATENSMFNHYHDQGDLIIIIAKIGEKIRKWQLHYESNQFMDERDQEISQADIKLLSKIPEYTEFLNTLIKKHYYGEEGPLTVGAK